MIFSLFEKMGLQNFDLSYLFILLFILVFILLIFVIILMIKYLSLSKRFSRFMQGKNAESLEKNIADLFNDNKLLKEETNRNKRNIDLLFKKMEGAYQKVGIVKYDAFSQMGGQLSFALALLDENDCGFVINSIHSSEGCYFYTKEIDNGICSIALGDEEKRALDKAMGID